MSKTLNSITERINQQLQNDYKEQDKLRTFISGAATCQTLVVNDSRKFIKGDKIEIDSEVLFILEAPKQIDYLNESSNVAASITAIKVKTSASFTAGCYMKIESEDLYINKVSAIGSDNMKVTRGTRGTIAIELDATAPINYYPNLFVRRAYGGSTAAFHSGTSLIYVVDGWAKFEILENVKREMESLFPNVSRDFLGDTVGDVNRKQLNDADTVNEWTKAGDADTPVLNSSDEQEGTSCLDLGATYSGGTATYSATPTSFDASSYDYLNIWIYLEKKFDSSDNPYVDNNALEIRIGSDSSNFKYYRVGRDELKEGAWTLLNLPIAEFTSSGTPVMTAVDYIAIIINDKQSITSGDIKMDEWFMTTYPVTSNKLKIRLPTGVKQIDEVRILEDEGSTDFSYCRSYQADEKYLYLAKNAEDDFGVNKPIIIKGQKQFVVPSTNTAILDIEDELEELIILGASIRCIDQKLLEILRSDKLSVKYQEGYSLDLDRIKQRLQDRYYDLRERQKKSQSALADWNDYG